MDRFLTDAEVVERTLSHIEHKTTDRADTTWHEPVENYRSEERLEQEMEVIRKSSVPFCPSAALPDKGSYVARESAGTALLVVRDNEGKVRAFINACRHRGTQLVTGEGCTSAFVCPYHGWAYRLDGGLQYIPHEDGFPDTEKSTKGLVPVHVEEKYGIVFVTVDSSTNSPVANHSFTELINHQQKIIHTSESVVDANWKVYLESFIEGYHIRYTHTETFYPFGYDNLNVVEKNGVHSRVTYPFKRIESLGATSPSDRQADGMLAYVYHLFPNALLTVLTHHTNLIVLEPTALDRTRVVTYRMTNKGEMEGAKERANRDSKFVGSSGAEEDMAVVLGIQRSINSGANDHFVFGHFEPAIAHFHHNMKDAIERSS